MSSVKNQITVADFKILLAAGAVWGVTEVIMGTWLNGCATMFSGAIMTGLAFFYMSLTWSATRKILPLLLMLVLVILFKMLNALLLSLPVTHGSVMNPAFAFVMQTIGFLLMILIFRKLFFQRLNTRIMTGIGAAAVAVLLFPFAGHFTGSAACLAAGTQIPLSIYTSPLAIGIACITVPLGYHVAQRLLAADDRAKISGVSDTGRLWPAFVFIVCVALVVLHSGF